MRTFKYIGTIGILILVFSFFCACKKNSTEVSETPEVDINTIYHVVTFIDYDGTVLSTQEIEENKNATAPQEPSREGYIFMGWDKELTNVIEDMTVTAQYLEDNKPVLMMNSVEAHAGDSGIEVLVSVKNNPGILGLTLSVEYDESIMKLTDSANGEAVSDVLTLTTSNVLESGCRFAWDGQEILGDDIKDGTILVLSFDILESVDNGTYEITLSYEDIYDNNVLPLTMDVKSGTITIS